METIHKKLQGFGSWAKRFYFELVPPCFPYEGMVLYNGIYIANLCKSDNLPHVTLFFCCFCLKRTSLICLFHFTKRPVSLSIWFIICWSLSLFSLSLSVSLSLCLSLSLSLSLCFSLSVSFSLSFSLSLSLFLSLFLSFSLSLCLSLSLSVSLFLSLSLSISLYLSLSLSLSFSLQKFSSYCT